MNTSLQSNEVIEDGLDRQNLAILHKRFNAVNDDRLERMRGALSDRAQLFMDALPLLFHCNHPMLPGYVSSKTPARISHFKPSKRDVLVGKMVARSFTLNYDPSVEEDIYGIYIMGSVGTIAQGERSDLDIWICHRPGLQTASLRELQRKCERISKWAEEMRLEVHFFLMDLEAFKNEKFGELNKESSGSAQHLLLLDEFYRTAIFIAGRTPLWWLVPKAAEKHYKEHTNTLLYRRFIPSNTVLDFGGVAKIPVEEFLGAGIWQLYKAIESPYKSILKLLLLESYVADYPDIEPLSLTYKNMIYEGELDINALDSYVMIYRRIENTLLKNGETKRLDLARRCFYFKVNIALSRPPAERAKSWQRLLLEDMVKEWGWPPAYIRHLDNRQYWKAANVSEEYRYLVHELNHCYRFLLAFANETGKTRAIKADELMFLGRKLQAAFERRPGKIEAVNPGISDDLSESVLILCKTEPDNYRQAIWTAFSHEAGLAISEQGTPVKSAPNLVELLLWCYCNRVITRDTRIELTGNRPLNALELKRLLTAIKNWLPLPLEAVDDHNFHRPSVPVSVMFLINAGKSPTAGLDDRGLHMMSDKVDALSYGGAEENLVASVDVVVKNSWNEIGIQRFEGPHALLDAMSEYLQLILPGTTQRPPEVEVNCVGSSHTNTIAQRVKAWFDDITNCFFGGAGAKHKRFIFRLTDSYYCLQFKGMKPIATPLASIENLIEHLAQEQDSFSPIALDKNLLRNHPLHIIALSSRPNAIDVYFIRHETHIEFYISDERGTLTYTTLKGHGNENPLKPLHRFLRSALYRQAQINPEYTADFGVFPINYTEISRDRDGHMSTKTRSVTLDAMVNPKLDVRAIAHANADGNLLYDYYCEGQEFLGSVFGDQLELVVSQYILSRRQYHEQYPVYITDLDLEKVADKIAPVNSLQIAHYLKTKYQLEIALNRSIGILINT